MAAFHRIEYDSISGEARKSPVWSIVRPVTVLIIDVIKVLQQMGKNFCIEPENEHETARTVTSIQPSHLAFSKLPSLSRVQSRDQTVHHLQLGGEQPPSDGAADDLMSPVTGQTAVMIVVEV